MRIVHRFAVDPAEAKAFVKAGARAPEDGIISVREDEPCWQDIQLVIKRLKLLDISDTEFTNAELNSSNYLQMTIARRFGYPQPEDTYLDATYDLTNYCSQCATGQVQNALFQFRRVPEESSIGIVQPYWVGDEFFVSPETWAKVFKPFGIACQPTINSQSHNPFSTLVQLTIDDDIEVSSRKSTICPVCQSVKYIRATGFAPVPLGTSKALVRSTVSVSGAKPHKMVFISNELYQALKSAGLKGVQFAACSD